MDIEVDVTQITPIEASSQACPQPCERCAAREISICSVLPHHALLQLADRAAVTTYAAGDILVHQGDPSTFVFNITDGTVMLFRLLSDGRRQVIGFLFKGDFLGLTGGAETPFGAQALNHVQACRFPRAPFRRLVLETPRLEEELLSRASDELLSMQEHLILLGRKTAMERVASFLIYLAAREARLGGAPDLAFLSMTRTDMADFLGLTTETVSRMLSTLKRQGAIRLIEHGGVRITGRDQLARLAEAI